MAKFEEVCKNIGKMVIPNAIITSTLVGARSIFGIDLNLQDLLIYNLITAAALILLWHELRIRKIEKRRPRRKKSKKQEYPFTISGRSLR